jgi:hypothetical protein
MTPTRNAQRLRRAVYRRGLTLEVARRRDPSAPDFKRCTVRDGKGRTLLLGSMTELERWLTRTSPTGQVFTHPGAFA